MSKLNVSIQTVSPVLSNILNEINPKTILLVTGKNSYILSGARDSIELTLKGFNYVRFFDFEENPKIEDVKRGLEIFHDNSCDLIISVGGGSVIDMGKLISGLSSKNNTIIEMVKGNRLRKNHCPIIAIPTTGGTGSEATHFAVVYIDGEKHSYTNENLLPYKVILDPRLTYSKSPYLTAVTGADALCQSIESMWAVNSTRESKRYAERAIKLLWENLPKAVLFNDKISKDNVMKGSFLAGKAINISKTTASHALSYKLTSLFNITHGQAVAITLSEVMRINYCEAKEEIDQILTIIGAFNLTDGIQKLQDFWIKIGLEVKLSSLGLSTTDIPSLKTINIERMKNNPVKLSADQIEEIFKEVF